MVTLPLLKKQVKEDDLGKDGKQQWVPKKDENDQVVYVKENGEFVYEDDKDGQRVKKVEKVVKQRTVEKNRAVYIPFLTCKKKRMTIPEDDKDGVGTSYTGENTDKKKDENLDAATDE